MLREFLFWKKKKKKVSETGSIAKKIDGDKWGRKKTQENKEVHSRIYDEKYTWEMSLGNLNN